MRVNIGDDEIHPWADFGLRVGDLCRSLWFSPSSLRSWVLKLKKVHRYTPRHSLQLRLATPPMFMRTWYLL
jgi:hypothetical protein